MKKPIALLLILAFVAVVLPADAQTDGFTKANARVAVRKNTGADVGKRRRLNLIEGSNVTLTVTDDSGNEEIDVTIAAAGGGGLSDADYGDITVSGGGTAMTIDNNVVSNAKAADMAANTVKANATAGSADPADLAVGANTVVGRAAGNIVAAQLVTGQIADANVTYAKIQDVTATNRVLCRDTAGAGVVEECTSSAVVDMIGATQGQILYRGAAGWAALAPDTDGEVLTTHGAGADPTWEPGGAGGGLSYAQVAAAALAGF